jgi:proteasome assembly chaperone (PAC2) family protein
MSLVNELIKGLLPEEEKKKVVAVYGGGFKPPTSGHFKVVKQALEENPEIDEMIILIGGKPRNGITPDESILIWDIYKTYLPFKVEVKYTSVPPIKGIYNYAKEHPDEEVLFIIGAREGNEDDFADISTRTKSLDKYPNLNLRTIVTQGGVSGTAARNASKISLDKFKPFVPSELSDEEVEQVYNIVADKIQENKPQDGKAAPYGSGYDEVEEGRKKKKDPKKGTGKKPKKSGRRLYTDEDPKDTIGIKFSTRQDIVDTLNKKSFKAKSHARQSQIINLIHQRVRAAYGRAKDPAVKKRLKTGLDYITKRKEASKAKTQRLKKQKLKENASYSQHIDVMEKISELTDYMIDNGMNIQPLPTLEFIDGDSENAKDFFGKTAYYDPNKQHIVLYTEGRHPKDIVRSYAHEMIHHIQYLEDRLGDVSTTNTMEDDHLDKIEQEANLRGTMTFRNWTDSILNESIVGDKIKCNKCGWSWNIVDGGNDLFRCHKCMNINEGKKKDPFGLMAYARELGQLNEEESEYKVYLDMDGVLADFDQRFRDLSGMEPRDFENKYGKKAFWNLIDEENKIKFWVGIPVMPGAADLVDAVKDYDYELLTSPSAKKQSYLGKILWVRNNTGNVFPSKPRINFKKAKEKHLVKPQLAKTDILIDDREDTIGRWNAAGGTGIVYKNIGQVLNDLKKLGL